MWVFLVSIVGFSLIPDKKDVNLSAKPYIANKRAENYFNGKTPAGKFGLSPMGLGMIKSYKLKHYICGVFLWFMIIRFSYAK